MPPSAVKTIKDLFFWQYAKIISDSAHFGKKNFGFIMSKFKELQSGKIHWSTSIREYIKEHEEPDRCIYCGQSTKLTVEHILPRSRGGEDIPDNVVWVCQSCNSGKGSKRLYEWGKLTNKDNHHRIAEGKYLKYLYTLHENQGTLECDNIKQLCQACDMGEHCKNENSVEKLSVYCLEGCFLKRE
ncbi:MAG: HNH endonuclease [Bacteroidales bacterium]|nr:HNH endonuclease [Bacteroidales bacterium]